MIINWDKYVKNALPIGLRMPKLIQLVTVLLSGITSRYSELLNYMDKARLYASCTWQVCWLEFMLRLELDNETINIQEGDGLPYDFEIYGVPYADSSRVIGIVGRFKLAGKSFHLNFDDVDVVADWSNYICQVTDVFDTSAQWGDYLCQKEIKEFNVYISTFGIKTGTVSKSLPGPFTEETQVLLTATENYPTTNYFWSWEIWNGSSWEFYSAIMSVFVTVGDDLYLRATYDSFPPPN